MQPLHLHQHENALEICYLARGRQCYEVSGGRYQLRGGDLFLNQPGEEHGTGQFPEEKGLLYWLILINPECTDGSLLGLSVEESKALWGALTRIRQRHFPGGQSMKSHLDVAISHVMRMRNFLPRVTVRNHLLSFVLELLDAYETSRDQAGSPQFAAVYRHIEANLADPDLLQMEVLARIAGLSTSRFKTAFRAAMGMPPGEFVLRARIAEAERRLARPGNNVTRVAFDLGFSSSQYFASVFRRFLNKSPREFKKYGVQKN